MAPRNAYLEFEAHPARITPYTPAEVSASRNSSPALTFAIVRSGDSGITAQAAKAVTRVIIGARANRNLLAFAGMITSLVISLTTSAKGWPRPGIRPKIATRFGPRRSCIQPMTLRSHSVVRATQMMRQIVTARIHKVEIAVERTMSGSEAQALVRLFSTIAP